MYRCQGALSIRNDMAWNTTQFVFRVQIRIQIRYLDRGYAGSQCSIQQKRVCADSRLGIDFPAPCRYLKVVTNEEGEAVGDVLTIIC